MTNQIKDGSGKGFLAKVTEAQKLTTLATVISNVYSSSFELGQAYVITTDFLSITDTLNFSGIMYLQNNSNERHLHLELIQSGQTSLTQWQFLRNPITGTIVSTEDPANETNLNFISNNTANVVAYQGFNGATIAGLSAANWIGNAGGFPIGMGGAIILGPGDSVGFAAKPSAAGTITMSLMVYYDEITT
jgi:hypothetical protein